MARSELEFHLDMAEETAKQITPGREIAMVKTKLEEAQLWLTLVPKDEPKEEIPS